MNYYNEIDRCAAQWLRNLIAAKLIPAGDVDERDIRDVQPADLDGYVQCHFFAGIAGWPLALALAEWPDDREAWTGSCPCQPFSAAGQAGGVGDERHLWPAFHRLIAERHPPVVFGEQVASAMGRQWLAGVHIDLEGLGYAVGAADLCAAGVGAPHIRQRLYWLADSDGRQSGDGEEQRVGHDGERKKDGQPDRPGPLRPQRLGDTGSGGRGQDHAIPRFPPTKPSVSGSSERLGDADGQGWPKRIRIAGHDEAQIRPSAGEAVKQAGDWDAYDLIPCADGKARRVEPGTFPLAHGVPGRVGRLRAYGNAIVPQVAAKFIRAYCEARLI